MKYRLILPMTPEKNTSVSSETLHRNTNERTKNCNTIKGKIWRSELQLSDASTPLSLQTKKLSGTDMTNPDIGIKFHTVTPNNTTQTKLHVC